MARIQEMTMNRGSRMLLFLAITAGIVAAVLVFVALSQDDNEKTNLAAGGESATVVVAAQNISAGTEITDRMLKTVEVPAELVVAGAYTDQALLVGQKARVPILAEEQVATSKLGADNDTEGLAGVVPLGSRGFALRVSDLTAVSGLLLPGNRVDVYMSVFYDRETDAPFDDTVTHRLLLQDIEVLSVAQEAQEPAPVKTAEEGAADPQVQPATSGQLPEDVAEQPGASTVTLALTPEQVPILACAQQHGEAELWVALRAFGEPAPENRTVFDPCAGIGQ